MAAVCIARVVAKKVKLWDTEGRKKIKALHYSDALGALRFVRTCPSLAALALPSSWEAFRFGQAQRHCRWPWHTPFHPPSFLEERRPEGLLLAHEPRASMVSRHALLEITHRAPPNQSPLHLDSVESRRPDKIRVEVLESTQSLFAADEIHECEGEALFRARSELVWTVHKIYFEAMLSVQAPRKRISFHVRDGPEKKLRALQTIDRI